MRGEDIAIQIIDLALDDAAGIVQDMQKCLMLAMEIRKEMLRALGQTKHGAQMRHFGGCFLNGMILLAQQFEITDILRSEIFQFFLFFPRAAARTLLGISSPDSPTLCGDLKQVY